MRVRAAILSASLALGLAHGAVGESEEWRQFRGNDTSGVSATSTPPTSWSQDENLAWSAALPGRGISSPIVVGGKVVVTAGSGYRQDRLHVLAFDAKTGELAWERQFQATGRTQTHEKIGVATPTPASDGERIFAFYSSNDVICLDLDGNLLWYRGLAYDYPNISNSLGMSSSPVVVGDTLVVQAENDSQSMAFGIDTLTGESRWSLDRPKKANWTSPIVLTNDAAKTGFVVLQSSAGLHAVEPRTGQIVWSFTDGAATIPSSAVSDGIVYTPSNGITALKPIPQSAGPEILWNVGRLKPGTASPVVYDGKLYLLNNAGVLVCAQLNKGDVDWQLRVPGPFSGTPVAAGGHLYLFNEKGVGIVVKPTDGGEIVSENDLGEVILCTPAIADDAIYVRSDVHLWKIAGK